MLKFLRRLYPGFPSGCTSAHSHQQAPGLPFSAASPAPACRFTENSRPHRHEVVARGALMINEEERLFIGLSDICMSSLKNACGGALSVL